ncbi:MAG TPA: hypothetical protein GXX73_14310 [Clostridium sp.]|nr:hypothetical protein [Clostridium sp.]
MKIIDVAILAFILLLPFSLAMDANQKKSISAIETKYVYEQALRIASEDATKALLTGTYEDGETIEDKLKNPNLDFALDRFNETLYINLNLKGDKAGQEALKSFLPIKLVVAYDGYYLNVWENVIDNTGKEQVVDTWLPKKPFVYYEEGTNLIFNFTITDYVSIYDVSTGTYSEGKIADMELLYPTSAILKNINFDNVRRQTIVESINDDLELYSMKYNYLARKFGFGYKFLIPIVSEDDWNNTIDGITFMAFLQGMPVPNLDTQINTYAFCASSMKEIRFYYGTDMVYHKEDCSLLINESIRFQSRKDAASEGYYPCSVCKP